MTTFAAAAVLLYFFALSRCLLLLPLSLIILELLRLGPRILLFLSSLVA